MTKFRVGDWVKAQRVFHGVIVALEEDHPVPKYAVEIQENGLIKSFVESDLRPLDGSESKPNTNHEL